MAKSQDVEVQIGDVIIELECRCGRVLVKLQKARKWSCPACRRPGIRTGRVLKINRHNEVIEIRKGSV
jgi:ubiquitin C-terminal hydrolase